MVVITDEQASDGITPAWAPNSYIINVAPYQNGIGSDSGWTRISGFSERAVDWMSIEETGKLLSETDPESNDS